MSNLCYYIQETTRFVLYISLSDVTIVRLRSRWAGCVARMIRNIECIQGFDGETTSKVDIWKSKKQTWLIRK
jgi:hypothetical protein